MVVARCHQRNAVAEPDAFGALRAGREEHLGRRGMRILLEKVMLDLPDVIDADPVGELHLFQRYLVEPPLGVIVPVGAPGARQLVLVEDTRWLPGNEQLLRGCSSGRKALPHDSWGRAIKPRGGPSEQPLWQPH